MSEFIEEKELERIRHHANELLFNIHRLMAFNLRSIVEDAGNDICKEAENIQKILTQRENNGL